MKKDLVKRILEGKPITVITTFSAFMSPMMPLEIFREFTIDIRKNGEMLKQIGMWARKDIEKLVLHKTKERIPTLAEALDVIDGKVVIESTIED